MRSKIDVIVPIYNVEQYLKQCLDSLAIQSLAEIRVICIDDGSTDHSSQILQDFAQADSRFVVIRQDNKGYGTAVNQGLNLTQANYVGIVEPDDFVDPFCFEHLYRLALLDGGVDIAKCAYYNYYDAPDGTHRLEASASSKVESHLSPFKIAQYPELLLYHPSIWSGLYRRHFLDEHKLRLVEAPGAGWTDNPFFMSTMCLAKKIVWSNERHYYYRRTNPDASSNLKDCRIPLARLLDILDFLDTSPNLSPVVLRAAYKRCLNYIQIVTEHSAYTPEIHNPMICQVVSKIPHGVIENKLFTVQERAIYRVFSGHSCKIGG